MRDYNKQEEILYYSSLGRIEYYLGNHKKAVQYLNIVNETYVKKILEK